MDQDAIKKRLGIVTADLIQPNTIVGLGTGTTAHHFIEHLATRCRAGLKIQAVASSRASHHLAEKWGIPLIDINTITHVDITVDGADQVDPQNRLIKGGGGALVREKILATMSHEVIIIVDETKLCKALGNGILPVAVIPFATQATKTQIESLGFTGNYRKNESGTHYITDNHNYIFDIHFTSPREHPETDHELLIKLPAVVETGYFFNLATRVCIGHADGTLTWR